MRCYGKNKKFRDGQCPNEATKVNCLGHNVCDDCFILSEKVIRIFNDIAFKYNYPPLPTGSHN